MSEAVERHISRNIKARVYRLLDFDDRVARSIGFLWMDRLPPDIKSRVASCLKFRPPELNTNRLIPMPSEFESWFEETATGPLEHMNNTVIMCLHKHLQRVDRINKLVEEIVQRFIACGDEDVSLLLEDCEHFGEWMTTDYYMAELEARLRSVAKGYFVAGVQLDVAIYEEREVQDMDEESGLNVGNRPQYSLDHRMWMNRFRHERLKGTFPLSKCYDYDDEEVACLKLGLNEEVLCNCCAGLDGYKMYTSASRFVFHSIVYRPSRKYRVRMFMGMSSFLQEGSWRNKKIIKLLMGGKLKK